MDSTEESVIMIVNGKETALEEEKSELFPSADSNQASLTNSRIPLPSTDSYYCQICFENNSFIPDGYELTKCRHVFCRDCLVSFLRSKIEDGQVFPKCFHMSEIHTKPNPSVDVNLIREKEETAKSNPGHELPFETVDQQTIYNHTCHEEISPIDIQILLKNDKVLLEKYDRFKFCRENKNARECPHCHSFQLGFPDTSPTGPKMICQKCQGVYCFYHSVAHGFDSSETAGAAAHAQACEEYEKSAAKDQQSSVDFIKSQSKPCPVCGVMVMKSGGCNHMKCQCGAAFCWLCGKQIEDTLFPAHFQWWNPTGCSNLQMNESVEPSRAARVCARILSVLQIIVLGPITLASTLASTLLCFSCICVKIKQEGQSLSSGLLTTFSNCMSTWGVIWMVLIVFLPLVVSVGGVVLGLAIGLAVALYPCYFCVRVSRREYPWPDLVTETASTVYKFVQRRMCSCCVLPHYCRGERTTACLSCCQRRELPPGPTSELGPFTEEQPRQKSRKIRKIESASELKNEAEKAEEAREQEEATALDQLFVSLEEGGAGGLDELVAGTNPQRERERKRRTETEEQKQPVSPVSPTGEELNKLLNDLLLARALEESWEDQQQQQHRQESDQQSAVATSDGQVKEGDMSFILPVDQIRSV